MESLLRLFALEHVPTSLVDSPHFRDLLFMLNRDALAWLPKKDTLTGSLDLLGDQVKLYIAEQVPVFASTSTDQWTHRYSGRTLMGATAHWYDPEESVMKNTALELNSFQEHDAATISTELAGTFQRFLIAPPAMTTDNHRSMVKALAMEAWDGVTHVRCVAHTINRAVQDGLKVPAFKKVLAEAKDVLKWVRRRFIAIRDAVVDPQDPKGPALRGPVGSDGKHLKFMRKPPDNNPTRWSDDLDALAWFLDEINRAWGLWLQQGNLRGEVISDTPPSIPGHDFRDGLERLTVLKALYALLHGPSGKDHGDNLIALRAYYGSGLVASDWFVAGVGTW